MKKVNIEKDECIGCGMCTSIAPDNFEMGENNTSSVKTPMVSDDNTAVEDAMSSCPVSCISVTEVHENEEEKSIKVSVDKSACIGCGACVSIAPSTFEFDEDGLSSLKTEADLKDVKSIREASESCPTSAIKVEE